MTANFANTVLNRFHRCSPLDALSMRTALVRRFCRFVRSFSSVVSVNMDGRYYRVYLAASTIPCGGVGLFIEGRAEKGDIVCFWSGEELDIKRAEMRPSPYIIRRSACAWLPIHVYRLTAPTTCLSMGTPSCAPRRLGNL